MDAEKPYTPISCELYDYVEIACMRGYDVSLGLRDGSSIQGKATTTQTKATCEFLVIQIGAEAHPVRLDLIAKLQVLSRPSQFEEIDFG